MKRRNAVTLMEVLISMFIMAIGMLALLALFPVGAVSMAQALKDDRCAYASTMADTVAIVNNVRYGDANITGPLGIAGSTSGLVYVDPYGVALGNLGFLAGTSPGIPRVSPVFVGSAAANVYGNASLIDRWFSVPDDIGFSLSGTPDTSSTGGFIDRGRRYSIAYLLRQQPPAWASFGASLKPVQLFAVVYAGRPVNTLSAEATYNATLLALPLLGTAQTNFVTLPAGTTAKRGGWILDTSYNAATGQINGYFYRVTNLAQAGAFTTVEVQQTLLANVTQITVMDNVAEVFDKGVGWQQ